MGVSHPTMAAHSREDAGWRKNKQEGAGSRRQMQGRKTIIFGKYKNHNKGWHEANW